MYRIIALLLTVLFLPLSISFYEVSAQEASAQNVTYDIRAVWADVESNYGDELVNPIIHKDGMRTADITFTCPAQTTFDNAEAIAAVYDADGKVISINIRPLTYSENKYIAECSVKVPETMEYHVKTMIWDSSMRPICEVKEWNYNEFREKCCYKVAVIQDNGTYLRRATFENDIYDFFSPSDLFTAERVQEIASNSGSYCLKIDERKSKEAVLTAVADALGNTDEVTVSCYVRNLNENANGTYYLQTVLPLTDGRTERLNSGRKSVRGGNWTKLQLTVNTAAYDLADDLSVRIMTDGGTVYGYYIDDFMITSSQKGEFYDDAWIESPTLIEDTGVYTIRQTFETDTFGKITLNSMADYYTGSEVAAHSGEKYLNVVSRARSDGTLLINLDGVDSRAVVYVECWVRNKGDKTVGYLWQAKVPTKEKDLWVNIGDRVVGSDRGWKKICGTLDLSQYALTGTPMLQMVAGSNGLMKDFLVDDLLIQGNVEGEFYDDMLYITPERDTSLSSTPNCISTEYKPIEMDIPALKDVYKDYFKIGACIPNSKESDTSRYGKLLKKHFNSVVSNGYFNMREILPDPTNLAKYEFSNADKLMDFAVRNGIEDIAGHCLIYEAGSLKAHCRVDGTANGKLMSRDALLAFMQEYITKVIRHFEGDGEANEYKIAYDTKDQWHVDTWNVVNEAVEAVDGGGNLQYVNQGAFINVLGEEYVEYAFQYAQEAGYEDISLRYNDYDEHRTAKAKGIYTLVKKLRDKDIRVDSIGMQSHYNVDDDISQLRNSLDLFASLGVRLDVTELDIQAYSREQLQNGVAIYEEGIPKDVEFAQTRLYEELFDIYREYKDSIDRVVFWSVDDRYSYFNQANFNKTEYAGIFDRNFRSKPQYWAIADTEELENRYPEYKARNLFWDFESELELTTDADTTGKWSYAVALTGDETKKLKPRIVPLSEVQKSCEFGSSRAYTKDAEYKGTDTPSAGSLHCVEIPNDPSGSSGNAPSLYFNGMKVNLSDKQLVPGQKYKMSFYVANNHTSRGVHAKLMPKGEPEYYLSRDSKVSWLTAKADNAYDALSTTHWQRQEIILSPKKEDFDKDGVTSLYLMFTRNPMFDTNGKTKEICPGEMFYVDDIRIEKVVSIPNMQWTSAADYSLYPVLGKWSYGTRDDHNGYYQLQTELLYCAERKNTEYIKYKPGYGITDTQTGTPPPTYKIATVSNAYTNGGTRNWPAKMGIQLKLSKEQLIPGKTYEFTFYGMTNDAPKGVYLKLRPFGDGKTPAYFESNARIEWIDIYEDTDNDGVGDGKAMVAADGILRQHWQRFTFSFVPEEINFDSNGYTNVWLIAAPEPLRYLDGGSYKTATITPGTRLYIDDITITEKS